MSHLGIIEIKIKEYQKLNVGHVPDVSWVISECIDSLKSVDYFVFYYYTRRLKNTFQQAQMEDWGFQLFFFII